MAKGDKITQVRSDVTALTLLELAEDCKAKWGTEGGKLSDAVAKALAADFATLCAKIAYCEERRRAAHAGNDW